MARTFPRGALPFYAEHAALQHPSSLAVNDLLTKAEIVSASVAKWAKTGGEWFESRRLWQIAGGWDLVKRCDGVSGDEPEPPTVSDILNKAEKQATAWAGAESLGAVRRKSKQPSANASRQQQTCHHLVPFVSLSGLLLAPAHRRTPASIKRSPHSLCFSK